MGMFDQTARLAATEGADFIMLRLRPLIGLTLSLRGWFKTRSIPLPGGPDRDADLIAIADEPDEPVKPANPVEPDKPATRKPAWLLIFEFQSQHDEEKPKVIHLEAMILLCHARDPDYGGSMLPLPVFVYLAGKCPGSSISIHTPTGRGFFGDPVLWEVACDSASATLDKVESGEYPWGAHFWISCMVGAEDENLIRRWLKLVNEKVPERMRGTVVYAALDFAQLAGRRPAWNRVLQGVNVELSILAQEMVERGELRATREALLTAVKLRFPGSLTPDVEHAVADVSTLSILKDWHAAAVSARTNEEFLAVLRR